MTTDAKTRWSDLIARLEANQDGARLRAKIKFTRDCWLWQDRLDKHRRGQVVINKKKMLAHRAVWQAIKGPIPEGRLLCHHCDNPQCVNPEHMYVGTQKDNIRDMIERRRHWVWKYPEKAREVARKIRPDDLWRGQKNPKAKLTPQQAQKICNSQRKTRHLALEYGVSTTTINRVRSGRLWSAS